MRIGAIMFGMLAGVAAHAQPAGSVQGIVIGDDGRPVANAWVSAESIAGPPVSLSSKTAKDGSYALAGVRAGTYRLCVQAPGTEYLNPCLWAAKPGTVSVAEGQKVIGQTIPMSRGGFVRVRVNDPQRRLSPPAGGGQPAPFLIGVWPANGIFLPLAMGAQDSEGRNYQLPVPWETDLKLSLSTGNLQVEDERRIALPAGGQAIGFRRTAQDGERKTMVFHIR